MKYRPNATTLGNEAFIMFSQNNTAERLQSNDQSEVEILVKNAHRKVPRFVSVTSKGRN